MAPPSGHNEEQPHRVPMPPGLQWGQGGCGQGRKRPFPFPEVYQVLQSPQKSLTYDSHMEEGYSSSD